MLEKFLAKILRSTADDVENGKFDCSDEQMLNVMHELSTFNSEMPLSKELACNYLHMSRSTFDSLVKDGKLPKGKKHLGLKELTWYRIDLDIAKQSIDPR